MGRRQSKRQTLRKKKVIIVPLETEFTCPFCNREKSCEVKMDKRKKVGIISCQTCYETYQTDINMLSEPIDVYNDWIDACEAAN